MLGQKDIDLFSNGIDYRELDELYNKQKIKKMEKRWCKNYENRRFKN